MLRLIHTVRFLPPTNEVCEGYVFTGVCLSTQGGVHGFIRGGMRGFIWGVSGFIWGVCGFIRGACVVLFRGACVVLFGGHAWLLQGGMRGCSGGCAWLLPVGGMHGCSWGGMRGCSGGACVVFLMRYGQ